MLRPRQAIVRIMTRVSGDPMNIFHIIWMVVIGLIVGILARLVLPGAQHLSLLMTALFGIAGSFIGGFIGMAIKKPAPGEKFHPAGMSCCNVVSFLPSCSRLSL